MVAYASVISLMNTIEHLLDSSRISLVSPAAEIIESAYEEMKSLLNILRRLDSSSKSKSRKKLNALDGRISEAVCELKNVLESHALNQTNVSQSDESIGERTRHPLLLPIHLQDLRQDVDSFIEEVKKMKEEYVHQLDKQDQEEDDDDDYDLSSKVYVGGKMVGLSDMLTDIRDDLIPCNGFNVVALTGMAGVGKTAVAKEMYEDRDNMSKYECRAWVKVGRKCRLNKIAGEILTQMDPDMDKMLLKEGDEKVAHYLKEILKAKRCLIVLDDIWDFYVCEYLISALPENNSGTSHILITTRLQQVAHYCKLFLCGSQHKIRLLSKEESWDLLRDMVFGEDSCPFELEKDGKKIAEICDGLPLMIITVADHLSGADRNLEYWSKVAQKQNSVFMDAYDEISKVLLPSYEYLPQHLKSLFLYMGVFPLKYEIPVPKLIIMCVDEGFLESKFKKTLDNRVERCLEELDSNSLVIISQMSIGWWAEGFAHFIETCRLHSSMWHLCHKEARKNKFFHALDKLVDGLQNDIISLRRLCYNNNVLLSISGMHNVMESDCASTRCSFLCYDPYNQYPVPICFGLRLLRVFDALHIHLHEFPMEVLELVQLRYLALTYNGKLPASVSKLWNLQFLIIHRHLRIKSSKAPSYVPIEIWDMKELKHLEIMGSNLPNSNRVTPLENLLTLVGVSPRMCTRGVLRKISNLKKLGIQIELMPGDDSEFFSSLNRVSRLCKLESLKCIVTNPGFEIVAPPSFVPMFPSCLKKLHLRGLGYPWKYMDIIAELPNLEVLKLKCYAFRGSKWEVVFGFSSLRFLEIEDTDLVEWKVGLDCFSGLNCLSLKHCYKLEKLH